MSADIKTTSGTEIHHNFLWQIKVHNGLSHPYCVNICKENPADRQNIFMIRSEAVII